MVEIAPVLSQLPSLLGSRPYGLEDEDNQDDDGYDDDAHEHDRAAGAPSTSGSHCFGLHTFEQLLKQVQVSVTTCYELARLVGMR